VKLPGWAGIEGQYGYGTRVAVAYRAERLHPTSTEHLFPNDSYRFPRPPLAVRFEIDGRTGVASFTLVVVHLKAQIDADSQERRRQAILVLEQWMNEKRTAGDAAIIVVGDFNDDIDDPPAYNVFQPFLARPESYVPMTLAAAQRGEFSYIPFKRLTTTWSARAKPQTAFRR
jgi:endonuclease/exonuclease/phosphatase family metal-dependent hydrolase